MSSSTISDDTSTQSSRFGGRGRYPPPSAARGRGDTSASSFTQGRAGGRISNPRTAPSTSYSTTNRNEPSSSNNTAPSLPASGIPYGHVPSYLPGSASLVEQLDQRLLVVLRDGRHLIGVRFLTT
jgi:U6 snRNA-associated Sm-like protein LSm1